MTASIVTAPGAWEDIIPRWQKYAPPAKPSAADVDRIRLRLDKFFARRGGGPGDRAEALVLGSTPELRTMLAGFPGLRVTLIDCVLAMMQAMTTFVDADCADEVWIKGDWLTAPLPAGYFDVVVSDLVLGNLRPDDQRLLMSRVRSVLKPCGRWVTRVDCVDEFSVFEDFGTLLEHFAELPGPAGPAGPSPADLAALRSVAGLCFWDAASGVLSYAKLGEAMSRCRDGERFVHPDPRVNRLLAGLWEITLPFGRPYWLSRKQELDAALGAHFLLMDSQPDDTAYDYPGRGYYVYDLAPR